MSLQLMTCSLYVHITEVDIESCSPRLVSFDDFHSSSITSLLNEGPARLFTKRKIFIHTREAEDSDTFDDDRFECPMVRLDKAGPAASVPFHHAKRRCQLILDGDNCDPV